MVGESTGASERVTDHNFKQKKATVFTVANSFTNYFSSTKLVS